MTIILEAQKREIIGKKTRELKAKGIIPAVLYGHGVQNKNLAINAAAFDRIFAEAGESTLVDLKIEGETPVKTLIADVQYEPVKHKITHVDFHQIRMNEKINAQIPVKFVGEAKAVKELGGVLVHNLSEVEIRCLPNDLIHEIAVDISVLNTFDEAIKISDLKLPTTIEIIGHEPDDVIAVVARPRTEEEMKAMEEQPVAPIEGEAATAEKAGEGETVDKDKKEEKKGEKK